MNKFRPNQYVKNVNEINYDVLIKNKIKLLCFDLDNTLDYPDQITTVLIPDIMELFNKLKKTNIDIYIMSNSTIKDRVKSFADIINIDYIEASRKPFQKKYKISNKLTKYKKNEIAFIGDKISTDILGGNIFGGYTILVDPIKINNVKKHQYFMQYIDKIFIKLAKINKGEYYNE